MEKSKVLQDSAKTYYEEKLKNTLPQIDDVYSGNTYTYEFMLQAWAFLVSIYELPQERFKSEFGNLQNLADSLSEYADDELIKKCYAILDCIRYFKERNCNEDIEKVWSILKDADNHSFIEIYYKSGVLLRRLKMYLNMGEYGAFGISQGSDILQILDFLLQDRTDMKALDLGSGNGFSTCIISNKVQSITGVEINSELYQESICCLTDLARYNKVDQNKITFVQSDFFDIDFKPFSLIYIYWPFDDKDKSLWEKEISSRLEQKIIKESEPGTLIVALIPGIDEKELFPRLKSIPFDVDTVLSTVKIYQAK
ncbi:MAG: class I SAM-dependent methyltransferase [Clostridia bacterium]|nr:class I SAM-dependent methyltransferase [Clostridia bacterium]